MSNAISRKEYMDECNMMAKETMSNENLPMATDILNYACDGKTSHKLQRIFDFFDDEEEFKEFVSRKNLNFTEQESKDFIDTVIAANVTEIVESGMIYKKLQAAGDSLRILGDKDCGSRGRELVLPVDLESFEYEVKNSWVDLGEIDPVVREMLDTGEKVGGGLLMFDDYADFVETLGLCGLGDGDVIRVRNPLSCVHHRRRGVCPVCAGKLPRGTQNVGAFATLMITEVATQNALSSMNKGKKANVNKLLERSAKGVKCLDDYYVWCEEILDELKGDKVQRRFFEIALLGRLFVDPKSRKIRVSSLAVPNSDNYFGEFIYRPNKHSFMNLIREGEFLDNSLKVQIGFNEYRKSAY